MNSQTRLQCSVIQHAMNDTKQQNWAQTAELIKAAASQGAKLICLPELHSTPYFCQTQDVGHFDLAETIPGPSTDFFSRLAIETNAVLVISLFEQRAKAVYHNTAVVIETNGDIAGIYRKMHIPDDPGYCEKFYFTPGDLGFKPIATSVGKLGVLVCWDQWFPEAARLMALAGADILLYPTAIGWDPSDSIDEQQRQQQAWLTIQRSHAIANHLPVLISNRIGLEDNNHFWGGSAIIGPQGEILQSLDENTSGFISHNIDTARTQQLRRIWPYFRDRRIDAYSGLLNRVVD